MASNAQPPYWGKVLRSGAQGPDVALVQTWLNGIRSRWSAIRKLKVDGKYGSATATAVKTFQRLDGIRDDGTVGLTTWDRLYANYATIHGEGMVWPGITMQRGNTGATVQSAQQRLQTLVPDLEIDGDYGEQTQEAVRAFQTVNGLTVDGKLGERTWNMLYD